jgi:hypothetical protein
MPSGLPGIGVAPMALVPYASRRFIVDLTSHAPDAFRCGNPQAPHGRGGLTQCPTSTCIG